MITFVYGGSGSGKSEFAESLVIAVSDPDRRYYIATMKAYGEEGRKRVLRHRSLRAGKGFQTIECPEGIENVLEEIGQMQKTAGDSSTGSSVVLIECVSNLVANEMFDSSRKEKEIEERIMDGLNAVCHTVSHSIIVSNNIFEDGLSYDETTLRYAEHLGRINQKIAEMADRVYEVVAGIPLRIK